MIYHPESWRIYKYVLIQVFLPDNILQEFAKTELYATPPLFKIKSFEINFLTIDGILKPNKIEEVLVTLYTLSKTQVSSSDRLGLRAFWRKNTF